MGKCRTLCVGMYERRKREERERENLQNLVMMQKPDAELHILNCWSKINLRCCLHGDCTLKLELAALLWKLCTTLN